jgi:hypothetical protein
MTATMSLAPSLGAAAAQLTAAGMTDEQADELAARLLPRIVLPPGMHVRCCAGHGCETLTLRERCDRHRAGGVSDPSEVEARKPALRQIFTTPKPETDR